VKPLIRPARRSFLESRRKRELWAKQSVPVVVKDLPLPPASGPGAARTYSVSSRVSSSLTPGPGLQHPDAPVSPVSEAAVPATSVLSPFCLGPLPPPPSHCVHSCPLACSCLFALCAGAPESHGPGKHVQAQRRAPRGAGRKSQFHCEFEAAQTVHSYNRQGVLSIS
jgi:hypothetical protein